jgi:hypothetical protein
MKSANELLTELVRHAQPPSGCAITLTESKPKISGDVNWIAGAVSWIQPPSIATAARLSTSANRTRLLFGPLSRVTRMVSGSASKNGTLRWAEIKVILPAIRSRHWQGARREDTEKCAKAIRGLFRSQISAEEPRIHGASQPSLLASTPLVASENSVQLTGGWRIRT